MLSELNRCTSFYGFGPWFDTKVPSDQAVYSMSRALPEFTWLRVGRRKLSDARNLALSLCHFSHVSDLEEGHSPKHCVDKCHRSAELSRACLLFRFYSANYTRNGKMSFHFPDTRHSWEHRLWLLYF